VVGEVKEESKHFFFEPYTRPDSDCAASAAPSSGREKAARERCLFGAARPIPQRGIKGFLQSFFFKKATA
jgi:hypothetical protein